MSDVRDGDVGVGLILGIGQAGPLQQLPAVDVVTPFGSTSAPVRIGRIGGKRIAMIARRGEREELAPHQVPYRANVWAMASLGVRALITNTASVGLRDAFAPGTYVVPDQILDVTAGRDSSFFDLQDADMRERLGAVQVEEAEPFDATLRALAVESLAPSTSRVRDFGTMVITNGPRALTTAEYRWYTGAGVDLTNMTAMPETALAREVGMGVVHVSFITEQAGVAESEFHGLEVTRRRALQAQETLIASLSRLVRAIPDRYRPEQHVSRQAIEAVLSMPR